MLAPYRDRPRLLPSRLWSQCPAWRHSRSPRLRLLLHPRIQPASLPTSTRICLMASNLILRQRHQGEESPAVQLIRVYDSPLPAGRKTYAVLCGVGRRLQAPGPSREPAQCPRLLCPSNRSGSLVSRRSPRPQSHWPRCLPLLRVHAYRHFRRGLFRRPSTRCACDALAPLCAQLRRTPGQARPQHKAAHWRAQCGFHLRESRACRLGQ